MVKVQRPFLSIFAPLSLLHLFLCLNLLLRASVWVGWQGYLKSCQQPSWPQLLTTPKDIIRRFLIGQAKPLMRRQLPVRKPTCWLGRLAIRPYAHPRMGNLRCSQYWHDLSTYNAACPCTCSSACGMKPHSPPHPLSVNRKKTRLLSFFPCLKKEWLAVYLTTQKESHHFDTNCEGLKCGAL